jgi:serine/threonine protein kinase
MSERPNPVNPGDLLAGKYRVEAILGSGGMGIVVAARHEQLDLRVAIKFIRPEALGNREATERFLREARAAARLKSEHTARVLDVGKLESGAPYMVMELLDGNDLAQVLREHGSLRVEQAVDWVVQACEAVAEAHSMGIVHRDIKPQNLFLARGEGDAARVKVLDFGVSKAIGALSGAEGALTHTHAIIGSPLYMSPEQMRSSRGVDARSDVWALGVVLFELLTAHPPFECDTLTELCLMIVGDPPRPLLELRPDAPLGLVHVILRCLCKDPAERFANAAELAEALKPFATLASQGPALRPEMTLASPRAQTASADGKIDAALASAGPLPASEKATTPAAWESGRRNRGIGTKIARPALWTAAVLAAAFAIAASGLALRRQRAGPVQASEVAPPVVVAPSSWHASPAPTVALEAMKIADPQTVVPSATTAPAPSPASPAGGSTPSIRVGSVPAKPPASPLNPAKTAAQDDDIPALR